jgi:phosphopantothenoylcysteine decarboxylase/phosphopantothenate--cysteine ligase
MNDNMWRHPATQGNLATLHGRGVRSVGPGAGDLACGTVDIGRMAEPEEILAAVKDMVAELVPDGGAAADGEAAEVMDGAAAAGSAVAAPWRGQRVVVTAGPTHEPLDPVRYLANRSSGVFGYAIATAALRAGAEVTLISGPTAGLPPRGLTDYVRVETAAEMAGAVATALARGADWLFMAAAVADFTPAHPAANKIKKNQRGDAWQLELVRTPDILGEVVPQHRQPATRVVGFALETEDLLARAHEKLAAKGLDFVVANDPTGTEGTFGSGEHSVRLLGPTGEIWSSEKTAKSVLAAELLARLGDLAGETGT